MYDCHGKHLATNRTYNGRAYDPVDEHDCVRRGSEDEARNHEDFSSCPYTKMSTCKETVHGQTESSVPVWNWNSNRRRGWRSMTVAGVSGMHIAAGGASHRPWYRTPSKACEIETHQGGMAVRTNEPLLWEFAISGWNEDESLLLLEGLEVDTDDPRNEDIRSILSVSSSGTTITGIETAPYAEVWVRSPGPVKGWHMDYARRSKNLWIHKVTASTGTEVTFQRKQTIDCDGNAGPPVYTRDGEPYEPSGNDQQCTEDP